MNSAELASALGDGWAADREPYPAKARKGFCEVRFSRMGWYATFSNTLHNANATARTPADAVRNCLLGVARRLDVTRADIDAVMEGIK